MVACIYYHPEAYTTDSKKLMGRNAAGESFLRGFLSYSDAADKLWIQSEQSSHTEHFESQVKMYDRSETVHTINKSSSGSPRGGWHGLLPRSGFSGSCS